MENSEKSLMRARKHEAGAAAVEFALILPLFLMIVFSIIEISIALYDKAIITTASREAARAGVVMKSPSKMTTAEIQQYATDNWTSRLLSFDGASPDVSVTNAQGAFGTPLSVTVNYSYTGLGLGSLVTAITGPIAMSSTTVMSNE